MTFRFYELLSYLITCTNDRVAFAPKNVVNLPLKSQVYTDATVIIFCIYVPEIQCL